MDVLETMLRHLHPAVQRDPIPQPAISISYDGDCVASIGSRIFRAYASGGSGTSHTVDLSEYTLLQFVELVNTWTGYACVLLDEGLANTAAIALIDADMQNLAAAPVFSIPTAPEWIIQRCIAWAIEDTHNWIELGRPQTALLTATGQWLMWWAAHFPIERFEGETDAVYARRIARETLYPRVNGMALEMLVDGALGTETRITDIDTSGGADPLTRARFRADVLAPILTGQREPDYDLLEQRITDILRRNKAAGTDFETHILPVWCERYQIREEGYLENDVTADVPVDETAVPVVDVVLIPMWYETIFDESVPAVAVVAVADAVTEAGLAEIIRQVSDYCQIDTFIMPIHTEDVFQLSMWAFPQVNMPVWIGNAEHPIDDIWAPDHNYGSKSVSLVPGLTVTATPVYSTLASPRAVSLRPLLSVTRTQMTASWESPRAVSLAPRISVTKTPVRSALTAPRAVSLAPRISVTKTPVRSALTAPRAVSLAPRISVTKTPVRSALTAPRAVSLVPKIVVTSTGRRLVTVTLTPSSDRFWNDNYYYYWRTLNGTYTDPDMPFSEDTEYWTEDSGYGYAEVSRSLSKYSHQDVHMLDESEEIYEYTMGPSEFVFSVGDIPRPAVSCVLKYAIRFWESGLETEDDCTVDITSNGIIWKIQGVLGQVADSGSYLWGTRAVNITSLFNDSSGDITVASQNAVSVSISSSSSNCVGYGRVGGSWQNTRLEITYWEDF